jgi:hypothetical protein
LVQQSLAKQKKKRVAHYLYLSVISEISDFFNFLYISSGSWNSQEDKDSKFALGK